MINEELPVNKIIELFKEWNKENSVLTIIKQERNKNTIVYEKQKIRKIYGEWILDLTNAYGKNRNDPSISQVDFNYTNNSDYKYNRILLAENHLKITRFSNEHHDVTYDIIKT